MNEAYLLMGGNIGNRKDYLVKAIAAIEEKCGKVIKASSIYETAAWGLENQNAFLNQVLQIKTSLDARELLTAILGVEEKLGRVRENKYGPRVIDIDILFFNNEVINLPGLTVPHPRMQQRRFVLVPLAEIAPEKIHPLLHHSVLQMLAECTDPLAVNKFC